MKISISQQIEEARQTIAEREVEMKGRKARGKADVLSREAEYRLARMEAALATLEFVSRHIEEFREMARGEGDG